MAADTMVMLDLLQEAGQEAVTLDELGVAASRTPPRRCWSSSCLGLEIQRVLVRGDHAQRAFECVRLAQAEPEQQTVELAAVAPRPAPEPAPPADEPRSRAQGIVLLAVLLALVALILRRAEPPANSAAPCRTSTRCVRRSARVTRTR